MATHGLAQAALGHKRHESSQGIAKACSRLSAGAVSGTPWKAQQTNAIRALAPMIANDILILSISPERKALDSQGDTCASSILRTEYEALRSFNATRVNHMNYATHLMLEETLYRWACKDLRAPQVHQIFKGFGYRIDLRAFKGCQGVAYPIAGGAGTVLDA